MRFLDIPGTITAKEAYESGLRDAIHKNVMLKDWFLAAFIAETGALPSECQMVSSTSPDGTIVTRIEMIPCH